MLCLFASKNRGLDEKQNPRRTYLKLTAVIWGGGGGEGSLGTRAEDS